MRQLVASLVVQSSFDTGGGNIRKGTSKEGTAIELRKRTRLVGARQRRTKDAQ
jgi:hypothetical protein